jgi:hypothetical protein
VGSITLKLHKRVRFYNSNGEFHYERSFYGLNIDGILFSVGVLKVEVMVIALHNFRSDSLCRREQKINENKNNNGAESWQLNKTENKNEHRNWQIIIVRHSSLVFPPYKIFCNNATVNFYVSFSLSLLLPSRFFTTYIFFYYQSKCGIASTRFGTPDKAFYINSSKVIRRLGRIYSESYFFHHFKL